MTDDLLFARAVWIESVRCREHMHRTYVKVLVYRLENPGIAGGGSVQEVQVDEPYRPLMKWCDEVAAYWTRAMSALASADPLGEKLARDCFREIARLVREIPNPVPPIAVPPSSP